MSSEDNLHAVVIAGGSGTRFWPLSRRAHPKQLLNLSGNDTLLHATFARVASLADPSRWWMVVGDHHASGCRDTAPEVPVAHVLAEPMQRNTAPAIALAAIHLARRPDAKDAVMVVLPADHHVSEPAVFCRALKRAAAIARQGSIVTLGITPSHPETGFGYIEQGAASKHDASAFSVRQFCEKPNLARAKEFLAKKTFLWNAGIFVMRPKDYLDELKRQLPKVYKAMSHIADAIGTPHYDKVLRTQYEAIEGVSIDYGVMEDAQSVEVVPVACGWSDVGSWSALGSIVDEDGQGNVSRGKVVLMDSENCVAYASEGHLVGLVGLRELVVVHTPDATLVVPKNRAQDVRQIIEALQKNKWDHFL